jgi:hypothetical protein
VTERRGQVQHVVSAVPRAWESIRLASTPPRP